MKYLENLKKKKSGTKCIEREKMETGGERKTVVPLAEDRDVGNGEEYWKSLYQTPKTTPTSFFSSTALIPPFPCISLHLPLFLPILLYICSLLLSTRQRIVT